MPGRTSFRAAAVIGSILLLAGCDDERAPEAQAPAAKPAVAIPASAPAPKPAAKPDPTAGLAVVKTIELREWVSEAPAYTNAVSMQQGEGQPLTISFSAGDKDKAAVRKALGTLAVPAGAVLVLQVANPNAVAVPIAIAVKTGKGWTYHESERMSVAPGGKAPQQLVFNLAGSTFKSEASQWKNNGAISDLDQAKELQICIYSQKAGEIIVNAADIRAKP